MSEGVEGLIGAQREGDEAPVDKGQLVFAVDRRSWIKVCRLGVKEAIAYLVLACGTGGDNRTTSWSVKAVETYAGMGRHRAQQAIARLKEAGLIEQQKGGTRPRYFLSPAAEESPDYDGAVSG
jgi:hypothetical protein